MHDNLKDRVYMDIPSRFDDSKSVEKVCNLKKSFMPQNNLHKHGSRDSLIRCLNKNSNKVKEIIRYLLSIFIRTDNNTNSIF